MPQGKPMPGEKYLHFKNKLYQIITVAWHSETMERFVVYQALYGGFQTYIRPYGMFVSEVDHEKYPEVRQTYRFQFVGDCLEETEENSPREEKHNESAGKQSECKEDDKEPEVMLSQEAEPADTDGEVNPWLMKFLDADTFDEKYQIVCDMSKDMTDKMIDDIAVVMDVVIPEGNLENRYTELKYCIRTRQKYETTRLR